MVFVKVYLPGHKKTEGIFSPLQPFALLLSSKELRHSLAGDGTEDNAAKHVQ